MRLPVVSEVGHVAIRVRDLAAAEEFATAVVGLHVTSRTADSIWLSHSDTHHSLQYILADEDAVDHLGLVAADRDAVAEIKKRVDALGLHSISDAPLGPGPEEGFAFEAPDGFVFEIYTRMERLEDVSATTVLRPLRFGHVTFSVPEPAAMQRLLIDALDFRVSDYAAGGAFLRCNVDHHGIAVVPGAGNLHHYAWEYPTMVELGTIADTVNARGGSMLWGPARHGIGRNIATYTQEPSELVVEFYSDMERIYHDANHVPGDWSFEGHKWISLWAPHLPVNFQELGLPPAVRARPVV